jgi:hypothetical protein
MGDPRAAEDRPHRLPVADPPVYRPRGAVPVCADRARLRRGRQTGAAACDIPGAEPFSHDGELCLAALFRFRVNNPLLMAASAVVGLIAFPLLQPAWVFVK